MVFVTMEGADNLAAVDPPIAQLPAFVRADVLNSIKLSIGLEYSHFFTSCANQFCRAFGDVLRIDHRPRRFVPLRGTYAIGACHLGNFAELLPHRFKSAVAN